MEEAISVQISRLWYNKTNVDVLIETLESNEMQVFREVVSGTPSSQLRLFNDLLHPILVTSFSNVVGNWSVHVNRRGKDGCVLITNPISSWDISRSKGFLTSEVGANVITTPRLTEGMCVRFCVDAKYQQDFEATIDSVVQQMACSTYQFQLLEDDIELDGKRVRTQENSGSKPIDHYIDPQRIRELRQIKSADFDLRKLITLCEEINASYASEGFYAVGMLLRATLDHVPPIFGLSNFSELSNNYGGGKSFQAAMRHLQASSRNIADIYLHAQARNKEMLPTRTQVDFRSDFDLLLAEVIRVLT